MGTIEKIIKNLNRSLENQAIVKIGWVNKIKDFETPVVSITTWQNNVDLNIWAYTSEIRDKITGIVASTLRQMEKQGVEKNNITVIPFEEKGVLSPGKWKVIKNSKPIFRKLVQIGLRSSKDSRPPIKYKGLSRTITFNLK